MTGSTTPQTRDEPAEAACPEGLNPRGVTCARCGEPAHGFAQVNDDWLCHCSCRDCFSGAPLPLNASWITLYEPPWPSSRSTP